MFLQYSAVHGSLLLFYFIFLQYTGFSCFYNAALATCHLPILQFLNSHCVKAAQKSPFLILSLQQNPLVTSRQCAFWWVMLAKRSRERKKRLGLVNQDHKYKALFLHCLHLPPQLPGTWYDVKKKKKSGDKESHGLLVILWAFPCNSAQRTADGRNNSRGSLPCINSRWKKKVWTVFSRHSHV